MKKTILFLITFCVLSVTKALAYTWTDTNGVTWTFSQNSYTINGTSQKLWAVTGASGYGESLEVPQTVYNGTTACTVEAIAGTMLSTTFTATSVILPTTIKYIYLYDDYIGVITLKGSTPPVLSGSIGDGVTLVVPSSSLSTYRNADVWSTYALQIISSGATKSRTISVTAMSNGSGIHSAVGEDNLGNLTSLTVSGTINSYDIRVIRDKMPNLHYLDLTNASVVANDYSYYNNHPTTDNAIGDYAFYELVKLITVKLPKTITSIGKQAFYECDGLKTIEFQTGIKTIGEKAFYKCDRLQTIALKQGLESIGSHAFYECWSLKTFTIQECKTIGLGAFYDCYSLTSISLPATLTSIGGNAFYNCHSLTSISLPVALTSIGDGAFKDCYSLTSISLPAALTSIGSTAFCNCSSLTSISIPDGVTTIGEYNQEIKGKTNVEIIPVSA